MKDLQGKVAVITGAGSGIGRALALAMSKEKAVLQPGPLSKGSNGNPPGCSSEKTPGKSTFWPGSIRTPMIR